MPSELSRWSPSAGGNGCSGSFGSGTILDRPSIMSNTAIVTGAGSGVGRAVALALARRAWHVALIGRNSESLAETAHLSGAPDSHLILCPCDIGNWKAVENMAQGVIAAF